MHSKILLVFVLHVSELMSTVSEDINIHDTDYKVANVPVELRKINYGIICRLQPNGYHCDGSNTNGKFYYDTNMQTCMTFEYGECENSYNRFNTLKECNAICMEAVYTNGKALQNLTSPNLICRLQPDSGSCSNYFPMYYYDIATLTCKGFSYTGCGGNLNRFLTDIECKSTCNSAVPIPSKTDYIQLN